VGSISIFNNKNVEFAVAAATANSTIGVLLELVRDYISTGTIVIF
jgi:hypothetical protein